MANPNTYELRSAGRGEVTLRTNFVVGSTGAVGAVKGGSEMKTPVRNDVGLYTFPLKEGWLELIDAHCFEVGTYDATKGMAAKLVANNVSNTSAPSVQFQFYRTDTGAVAEVATADVIFCSLKLKRF